MHNRKNVYLQVGYFLLFDFKFACANTHTQLTLQWKATNDFRSLIHLHTSSSLQKQWMEGWGGDLNVNLRCSLKLKNTSFHVSHHASASVLDVNQLMRPLYVPKRPRPNWFTGQSLPLRQIFEVLNRVVTQSRRCIVGFIFLFLSLFFFCMLQKSAPGAFGEKIPQMLLEFERDKRTVCTLGSCRADLQSSRLLQINAALPGLRTF